MSMMTARLRRSFTPEFKAHTVELVRTSGKSVGEVCRDLDLTETAVRRWIAQADIDEGRRDGLTTAEHEELFRLRREPAASGVRWYRARPSKAVTSSSAARRKTKA